jgi:hypothetical protein
MIGLVGQVTREPIRDFSATDPLPRCLHSLNDSINPRLTASADIAML